MSSLPTMAPAGRFAARLAQVPGFALAELMRAARQNGAVDLALGVPELDLPAGALAAAAAAIESESNQYANTWGTQALREAIARKISRTRQVAVDPDTEVTVTCGTTEGMFLALSATVDPGDEVIVFEPFYESYLSAIRLLGGTPRVVRLRGPRWEWDPAELRAAFSRRTKAVIVNTPANPTGKVFSREELETLAEACERWDAFLIADEIYEHMVYDGHEHLSPLEIPALWPRTISLGGFSKTFRLSGWRLGYAVAAPEITQRLRKVHDLVAAGVVAPLQSTAAAVLEAEPAYYAALARDHQDRRDRVLEMLRRLDFDCRVPQGGAYFLADVSGLGFTSDAEFVRVMLREARVVMAPGGCFHAGERDGTWVRVCFVKSDATLDEAESRLGAWAAAGSLCGAGR